jgi:hypothetical protein
VEPSADDFRNKPRTRISSKLLGHLLNTFLQTVPICG